MHGIDATIEAVKQIVADASDYPVERISLDGNMYLEYGLDSLGAIAVMVELQDSFGVPEPQNDEEYRELSTVRKLVDYVVAHRQ